MDIQEFRVRGKEMVEYICEFMSNIHSRRVTPDVGPGYLRPLLPLEPPQQPEPWEDIMKDVESKIMPGITHWQHPRFHAYFPAGNSFPSILGDMLSDAIGCIGFSWAASPACTELETIVCDWFGKAIGLPTDFLYFNPGSKGGGVIQGSASECVLVCMLAARAQAIARLKESPAHSHLDETALAIEADTAEGYIPFFVSTTLGTTACCSFDNLKEIGPICKKYPGVWLHVDAAYAGNAFICPELKYLMAGIEYADSCNTNTNKFLLTNFDCSCLWVRDRFKLTSALVVDPLYLQHTHADTAIDYRHWSIPLSRRFRSLKLWFVLRSYGISGLQAYIRNHIELAKRFEALVKKDSRFEVCNEVVLGLVCFRAKGSDKLNQKLLSTINDSGKLHMVPARVNQRFTIRFALAAPNATANDVDTAWSIITDYLAELLESKASETPDRTLDVMDELADIREKKRKATLEQRRSFFVRMVSDPAIQPGFTKTPNRTGAKLDTQATIGGIGSNPNPTTFRHLDTMVRLKAGSTGSRRGSSNGCSPEPSPSAGDYTTMNIDEFQVRGKQMVEYICEYLRTLEGKRVTANVDPGYLRPLLPKEAPAKGESWDAIMRDVECKIMPGITHWQHPRFHAYFPSGNSFPSILGDMLSDAIGCIGFSWAASPACTELETIVLDWYAKAIDLPREFLSEHKASKGGGVIQGSASECILVTMLAARTQAIRTEDVANGLVPFFVSTTLGTTGSCAFDNLVEIGPVCKLYPNIWLHVDGAYAGNAFICPEMRPLMAGIQHADSFNTNPNKWLLVNFDCSCLWVRDRVKLTSALVVDPLYLQHARSGESIDYRHWGIPLSRRFRALKLWFVMRSYGITGLQKYIRNHIRLARRFETLMKKDKRFEITNDVRVGLVCFRLKESDEINQELLANINASGRLHMIPARVMGKYILRFCVIKENATDDDIDYAVDVIEEHATEVMLAHYEGTEDEFRAKGPKSPAALDKKLVRKFSFTRSVTRDVYKRSISKSSLHDGATPIMVVDDNSQVDTIEEDVFCNSR
ncbi:Aromatic-L-amino-acid decarboxylase [Dufourea novaeangliae]|uniref:Aromatic-L-amino-acid decarboxylase n=1 Tax=Dufourea novaeangliae TaxID=178035 RepID=A0A154PP64_DUFNO|nr:Aromatic-L-amino-acid decarboxylase [Dufourea novaeangliae]